MSIAFYQQNLQQPEHLQANDPAQADYWAGRLGVPVSDLTRATRTVGTALHAVQQYLGCEDRMLAMPHHDSAAERD